jgi:high-affinity iron transporter
MLQAFVITLREGLEAFLIVAISLAYLKKTQRGELLPAVHWGIVASVALSIGAGLLLARARNQSLWEGVLGITAAFLVATMTIHMWRAGRTMKRDIEGRLAAESSGKTGAAAFAGVFAFTLLMITREGMETAMLVNALLFSAKAIDIAGGAMAVVAFRTPGQPRALLSSHRHFPARVRRSTAHLRFPRADRSEPAPGK